MNKEEAESLKAKYLKKLSESKPVEFKSGLYNDTHVLYDIEVKKIKDKENSYQVMFHFISKDNTLFIHSVNHIGISKYYHEH